MRLALAALLSSALASAQTTTRVSVDSAAAQGNGPSSGVAALSGDGRYVAFKSSATNLVAGDANGFDDLFVHDRFLGTTECISLALPGGTGDGHSALFGIAITGDGRFVAFQSEATNLVAGDTNNFRDIFVRDRLTGTTGLASLDSLGNQANSHSRYPSISDDGRFVVFASAASNLAFDTNGFVDIFVRDRLLGTTERLSVDPSGGDSNGSSLYSAISADGRFVAFDSAASNLVAGDSNSASDVFVRDRLLATTVRVSVDSLGAQADLASSSPSFSADGRCLAFESSATNLVAGDSNGFKDIFVRDLLGGTTERVSIDSGAAQAAGNSSYASLSADGRFVAFDSAAANLVAGDTNGLRDSFVHDRQSGTTERVSVSGSLVQGDSLSWYPSISANGASVSFWSSATNLVAGDSNGVFDVFVHDSGTGSPGSDLCQPGAGSVIGCPCANPPQSAPRGCDNSSATGGAQLVSSGMNSLSNDTLLFVTNGERPSATSILLQGDVELSGGASFGQGVRCAGGTLKRLYVKTAAGGSISAPGPGDPSVSARSAALNNPIAPGTSRWYAVYYRDPGLLGGCPATSTFNITQTQRVAWGV